MSTAFYDAVSEATEFLVEVGQEYATAGEAVEFHDGQFRIAGVPMLDVGGSHRHFRDVSLILQAVAKHRAYLFGRQGLG